VRITRSVWSADRAGASWLVSAADRASDRRTSRDGSRLFEVSRDIDAYGTIFSMVSRFVLRPSRSPRMGHRGSRLGAVLWSLGSPAISPLAPDGSFNSIDLLVGDFREGSSFALGEFAFVLQDEAYK
jgi:hypothetical protein